MRLLFVILAADGVKFGTLLPTLIKTAMLCFGPRRPNPRVFALKA